MKQVTIIETVEELFTLLKSTDRRKLSVGVNPDTKTIYIVGTLAGDLYRLDDFLTTEIAYKQFVRLLISKHEINIP